MDYANPDALVSPEWVIAHLGQPGVKILDATHFIDKAANDADADFREDHIPGAVRFDIDAICDPATTLPHMLPTPEVFAAKVGALGIFNADHVVVYDTAGMATAACRAWWMFRVFGHDKVSVLNGSYPNYLRAKGPVESGEATPSPARFTATFRPELVRSAEQVAARTEQVIDARSSARFHGEAPEPRPSERLGHIPGSINLPFPDLLTRREVTFKTASELREEFAHAGVDLARPVTTTCGSGVTACVLTLGLYLLGIETSGVYDGSWAEWNRRGEFPVEG